MVPLPTLLILAAAAVIGSDPAAATAPLYRVDNRLEADADRRDKSVFHSAPDSLRLNAVLDEFDSYRFPDRKVNGGARYRLRFSYLTAIGSVGRCTVRVLQYADTSTTWHFLDTAMIERALPVVGRWENVVIDFKSQPEATSAAIIFRVNSPCEVGECWIDNVSLCPAGMPITVGP
jgi:hypothetical protein